LGLICSAVYGSPETKVTGNGDSNGAVQGQGERATEEKPVSGCGHGNGSGGGTGRASIN